MSHRSDVTRLERIMEFIDHAQTIVDRHGSVEETISDIEGQLAVTMCIGQIGEILGRIENPEYAERLPIHEARGMRNMIIHQYDDLDLSILRKTIERSLPVLRNSVQKILDNV